MRITHGLFALFLGCSDEFSKADGGEGGADVSADSIGTIEGGMPDGGGDTMTPAVHRLFVGGGQNIVVYDGADAIMQDRMPDLTLGDAQLAGDIRSMELAGKRLYAFNATSKKLAVLDNLDKLTAMSAPAFMLDSSAFVGAAAPSNVRKIIWSPSGDLLITVDDSVTATQFFKNASTLASNAQAYVRVGLLNEPISAAVRDGSDRLFVGHTGQQIVKYVDSISTQSGGIQPVKDFAGTPQIVFGMVADSTRLYVLSNLQSGQVVVNIYNLSNIQPGSMPDATLTNGLPMAGVGFDIVLANDTLMVSYVKQGANGVAIFKGAKTAGNQTQGVPLSTSDVYGYMRYSDKTGLLYVAGMYNGASATTIWKDTTTTPQLQATLSWSGAMMPKSIALYEP